MLTPDKKLLCLFLPFYCFSCNSPNGSHKYTLAIPFLRTTRYGKKTAREYARKSGREIKGMWKLKRKKKTLLILQCHYLYYIFLVSRVLVFTINWKVLPFSSHWVKIVQMKMILEMWRWILYCCFLDRKCSSKHF